MQVFLGHGGEHGIKEIVFIFFGRSPASRVGLSAETFCKQKVIAAIPNAVGARGGATRPLSRAFERSYQKRGSVIEMIK